MQTQIYSLKKKKKAIERPGTICAPSVPARFAPIGRAKAQKAQLQTSIGWLSAATPAAHWLARGAEPEPAVAVGGASLAAVVAAEGAAVVAGSRPALQRGAPWCGAAARRQEELKARAAPADRAGRAARSHRRLSGPSGRGPARHGLPVPEREHVPGAALPAVGHGLRVPQRPGREGPGPVPRRECRPGDAGRSLGVLRVAPVQRCAPGRAHQTLCQAPG
jgi:hypothetical protein